MERLTKRINDNVYYTLGKYPETIPAECETSDVRTILRALAKYEDAAEQGKFMEVVRCIDCIYYDPDNANDEICHRIGGMVEPADDDFCSLGVHNDEA